MGEIRFHDHSTLWGQVAIYYKRINWQWVLAGAGICSILAVWAVVGGNRRSGRMVVSPLQFQLRKNDQNSNLKLMAGESNSNIEFLPKSLEASSYTFNGSREESAIFKGFPPDVDVTKIEHVTILGSYIDGDILTTSLQPLLNLKSISIETIGIVGDLNHFHRVHLPRLSDFKFSYLRNINADFFKSPQILHKILFFDSVPNQGWDFEKDVLNLGVNITVFVDGTVLLDINRPLGLLNINVHFCKEVLPNAKGTYSKLILSWCPITNPSLVSTSVKYLNLNNALLPPPQFSKLLKGLKQLEELHAFQPYLGNDDQAERFYVTPEQPFFQIPLNIQDFSKTLKILSLSRLALALALPLNLNLNGGESDPHGISMSTNIEDLSLEECNVTKEVLTNFTNIFPRLVTARLFNLKEMSEIREGVPAQLLYQVLQTPAVKIVVTGYSRGGAGSQGGNFENYSKLIEQFLSTHNLAGNETSFLILRNYTRDYNGNENVNGTLVRSLTRLEKNYKRFESMGFQDIDTFEDYLIYDSVVPVPVPASTSGSIAPATATAKNDR